MCHMRSMIIILAIAVFHVQSYAQCTGVIPATANIVSGISPSTITFNNEAIWVCGDAQVVLEGDHNSVYIEDNASIEIVGDTNQIWYKGSTPFILSGTGNNVRVQAFGDVDLQGPGDNSVSYCGEGNVVLSYQFAPSSGCLTLGTPEPQRSTVRIFPNPARDEITIEMDHGTVERIEIFTATGRSAGSYPGRVKRIPVSHLPSGLYMVRAHTSHGILNSCFIR